MKRSSRTVFLLAEGIIYTVYMVQDIAGLGSTITLKYASILLCILMTVLSILRGGDKMLLPALCLTAAADWFLLVRGDHFAWGVGIFLCVQMVYLLRLRRNGAGYGAGLRLVLLAAVSVGLAAIRMATPLNLLAGVYFSQLASNTILAWRLPGKPMRTFAIGLTLFMGCDLCVGLFNAGLPEGALYRAATLGMWFFYLPSQVLITCSGFSEVSENDNENK